MGEAAPNKGGTLNGFSPVSSAPVFWKSRKRFAAATAKNTNETLDGSVTDNVTPEKQQPESSAEEKQQEPVLSEKRKALFEPLTVNTNGKRPSAESLLPPPDFESASYPKGWLIGKKRKLVNVDVVESMRRIAVQEMNRKVMLQLLFNRLAILFRMRFYYESLDFRQCVSLSKVEAMNYNRSISIDELQDREIDGLNEQLEEDARCMEHLQVQLLEERSKRADVERQNAMLQNQIGMLMDMLQENDAMDDEGTPGNDD